MRMFFEAMGSGMFLMALITCVGAGILIGSGTRSIWGKIGWSIPAIYVILLLLTQNVYVKSIHFISQTGVLGAGDIDGFAYFTLTICTTLYLGSMALAAYDRSLQEAELLAENETISADDIIRELEVIAAHPALTQGWFGDRWKPMSPQERRGWVQQHIKALRRLRLAGGEEGFAGHDLQLPMRLAEIDLKGGT